MYSYSRAEKSNPAIAIHLNAYQPPRKGAHHLFSQIQTSPDGIDWTEAVKEECYKKLAALGLLSVCSFNLYATLREKLKATDPDLYKTMIAALGEHGVGDSFAHLILPDLTHEDVAILIGAGRVAFEQETGTSPKWFWPPETALGTHVLEALVDQGIEGFCCASEQIGTYSGSEVDNRLIRITLPSGRSILAWPFDSQVSRQIAFADKSNADIFYHKYIEPRLKSLPAGMPLLICTDAETFGHHDKGGHLFLEYLLFHTLANNGVDIVSPKQIQEIWEGHEIEEGFLRERTAWSCPHGDLVRWHGDCGCSGELNGEWKGPFYEAHHVLNDAITRLLEDYIGPNYKQELIENFSELLNNTGGEGNPIQSLLSAKVSALMALTSCGTFYESPHTSGHINVLFAMQAIAHLKDAGLKEEATRLQREYLETLSQAPDPTGGLENLGLLPRVLREQAKAGHRNR